MGPPAAVALPNGTYAYWPTQPARIDQRPRGPLVVLDRVIGLVGPDCHKPVGPVHEGRSRRAVHARHGQLRRRPGEVDRRARTGAAHLLQDALPVAAVPELRPPARRWRRRRSARRVVVAEGAAQRAGHAPAGIIGDRRRLPPDGGLRDLVGARAQGEALRRSARLDAPDVAVGIIGGDLVVRRPPARSPAAPGRRR